AAGTGTSSRTFTTTGAYCVACDFSLGMLQVGARRAVSGRQRGGPAAGPVRFVAGDALRLPFRDRAFDAVTSSFGLRNVADPDVALAEMLRVTRPGGRLVICEFGHLPAARLDAWDGRYLSAALPAVARRPSPAGDAYEYLAESIRDWPSQAELARRIGAAGWSAIRWRNLTLGVVTVHAARRPEEPCGAPPAGLGAADGRGARAGLRGATGNGLDSSKKTCEQLHKTVGTRPGCTSTVRSQIRLMSLW